MTRHNFSLLFAVWAFSAMQSSPWSQSSYLVAVVAKPVSRMIDLAGRNHAILERLVHVKLQGILG